MPPEFGEAMRPLNAPCHDLDGGTTQSAVEQLRSSTRGRRDVDNQADAVAIEPTRHRILGSVLAPGLNVLHPPVPSPHSRLLERASGLHRTRCQHGQDQSSVAGRGCGRVA